MSKWLAVPVLALAVSVSGQVGSADARPRGGWDHNGPSRDGVKRPRPAIVVERDGGGWDANGPSVDGTRSCAPES